MTSVILTNTLVNVLWIVLAGIGAAFAAVWVTRRKTAKRLPGLGWPAWAGAIVMIVTFFLLTLGFQPLRGNINLAVFGDPRIRRMNVCPDNRPAPGNDPARCQLPPQWWKTCNDGSYRPYGACDEDQGQWPTPNGILPVGPDPLTPTLQVPTMAPSASPTPQPSPTPTAFNPTAAPTLGAAFQGALEITVIQSCNVYQQVEGDTTTTETGLMPTAQTTPSAGQPTRAPCMKPAPDPSNICGAPGAKKHCWFPNPVTGDWEKK